MFDASKETPIPLSVAAREVPNRAGNRGISIPTIWRWGAKGVNGVRLETLVIGGQRFTSREALARFFIATTAARDGVQTPSRTPAARERAIAAAEKELAEAGI